MIRISFLVAALLLAFTLAAGQAGVSKPEPNSKSSIETEIKSLVREMHVTYLRCDKERLFSFFADDFMGTSYDGFRTTKADLVKIFQCPSAAAKVSREMEYYEVRSAGGAVIVSYRLTEGFETGQTRSSGQYLYTDVFVKRASRWQMIASHATRVPADPAVAKVDPALYDDYVGRYSANPSAIFVISRDEDKLLGKSPDGETVELLPENDTTFFLSGRGLQVIFERGKTGKVIRMTLKRPGGDLRLDRVNQ